MTATVDRHHGRHVVLFGRDYRWQHTDGRWTLRRETDTERDQRLDALFADLGWTQQ
jgi:hypothetical protein